MPMSEYLWILFGVLAVVAVVVVVWFILTRPETRTKERPPVHVDFDHYKGREGR